MKRLLIDAGNTRLKWASAAGARLGRIQSAAWSQRNLRALAARVMSTGRHVDAVLVCSVAGRRLERALRGAARAVNAPTPRFVASTRTAGGVRNAYTKPRHLGVDRWLALIGARQLYPRQSVCVVSFGTATTIDLLDATGRHRGGAIVPGPQLMVQALLRDTALIRRRAQRRGNGLHSKLFARDTRAAIEGGAAHARLAVVRHALQQAEALLGKPPRLVLTGGGAAGVAAALRSRAHPTLVFLGLQLLVARDEV
jgi:type III pantothenate kinase